ncbi:hypothetical protein VUR80DRAFT_8645 [Thermomyces stellatus]
MFGSEDLGGESGFASETTLSNFLFSSRFGADNFLPTIHRARKFPGPRALSDTVWDLSGRRAYFPLRSRRRVDPDNDRPRCMVEAGWKGRESAKTHFGLPTSGYQLTLVSPQGTTLPCVCSSPEPSPA